MTIDSFIQVLDDERVSEIVIVDDASTNGDGARLQEYFKDSNKVKVFLNKENLDCYKNKYQAVLKATNNWCILFDSDNTLTTEYIDTLFAIPEWDIHTVYNPQFARPHFDFRLYAGITFTDKNIKEYLQSNVMTAMNAMNFFINRGEYLKVWDGAVDPVTSDSIYFNYCWLLRGNKFYITPGLEYDHLVHKGHYQDNQHRTGDFHKILLTRFKTIEEDMETTEPLISINDVSLDTIYAAYCNLEKRSDRNEHMIVELSRVGLQAERFDSFLPEDIIDVKQPMNKLEIMYKRTKGAIGCHYSQVGIMEEGLKKEQHTWVMEDDLVYCDDIQDRLKTIFSFLNTHEWDIFWLGGTWHTDPTWHKSIDGRHTHLDLQMCTCDLNRDWEPTEHPNIVRTYGAFSTHSYIMNKKSIAKILDLLDQNVYRSMGIDWIMLLIQPTIHTYAFAPGCCKQYDNQSNIGNGISHFSGFVNLGTHWFLDKL